MASSLPEKDNSITRQEAREEKLRKKRAKMKQHAKGLAKIYKDAVEKRGRRQQGV
jgi:cell division protein FtsB